MNFLSDNAYGAAPEILSAIAAANASAVTPYGEDSITEGLGRRLEHIFEHELVVFPLVTGTAANALALATLVPPYGVIFCHEESHIAVDECGAPEFISGGAKLAQIPGDHAKLTPAAIANMLNRYRGGVHSPKPAAISISQATERGAVYRPDEIAELSKFAKLEGMALHMDGARFANALVHLNCKPADVTWKAGVDVLSFGATKNGALCAEAVIFFSRAHAQEFEYRRKRAGHLVSKMRFISVQLDAYLENERWLTQAGKANQLAKAMAEELSRNPHVQLAEPVQANEVFAYFPDALVEKLRNAGARFYEWQASENGRTLVRLVLSFLTPADDVTRFLALTSS